jgi:hypothetical protein
MKTFARKLFMFTVALFFINILCSKVLSQYDPDLPESLGRCLGVYKINSKIIPKEFSDFEYFYFDKLPNQDTDNPRRDSENRVFIRGKVKLKNNQILMLKWAFVRSISINGDDDNYKDIEFETEKVGGLSYRFKGEFLEEKIQEEKGSYTKAKGVLTKYRQDNKIAESKLKFFEYAEL